MKRQLEEAQQLKAGEVEKVIENRVKGLKADWDKQVAALTSERETLTNSPLLQPSTSTSSPTCERMMARLEIGDVLLTTRMSNIFLRFRQSILARNAPARRVPLQRRNGPVPPAVHDGGQRLTISRRPVCRAIYGDKLGGWAQVFRSETGWRWPPQGTRKGGRLAKDFQNFDRRLRGFTRIKMGLVDPHYPRLSV